MMEFNKPDILSFTGNISENFRVFKEDVSIYFTATKTTNEQNDIQVARLKNLLGPEGRKVYRSINTTEPGKETVLSIMKTLEDHCIPKKNETMEIFKFLSRHQGPNEPFERFYVALKSLILSCGFGDQEEKLLKSQIILGINSKTTQQKLLMSENNVSLQKVVDYCLAIEQSETNLKTLSLEHEGASSMEVFESQPQKFNCSNCGFKHVKNKCGAYGKQCHKCHRMNHYSSMCRQRSVNRTRQTHNISKVQANEDQHDQQDNFSLNLIGIAEVKSSARNKWHEDLDVEGSSVEFKIDTGAETNIIPYSVYNKFPEEIKKLVRETPVKLEVYGGFIIVPYGIIRLNVSYNGTSVSEDFFIVSEKNCRPILGLATCRSLHIIPSINVSTKHIVNVQDFIETHKEVFTGLGCLPGELKLKLKENAIPVSNPARRVPYKLMDRLKVTLESLESKGIISKAEPSEWCSNLVILEKKSGDLRLCIDPKELNPNLMRDYFMIPTIEQLSSEIGNKQYYCVFDLKDGFYQIKLDEASSKLCSFSTPFGIYKFLRAPFGLSVLPEHFQKLTQNLFGSIKGVKVYFDDIIACANSLEELADIVDNIFYVAKQNNVKFNPDKIQYFVKEVNYLGMKFNSFGIKPDQNRVLAIKNLQAPRNRTELQSIIGMINFLRPFICNLSELLVPFRNLLKKDVIFSWDKNHDAQLDKIKDIICNLSLLSNFDGEKPVVIQADASQYAVGCTLLQDNKPVFFASKCLSASESNFAQIEKELLAITFAFNKFHNYLYGHSNITVYTDHSPLVSIIKKSMSSVQNNRIRRLRLKLLPYSFELKYLPGKHMYIADLLSRNIKTESVSDDDSLTEYVHVVGTELTFKNDSFQKLVEASQSDSSLIKIFEFYQKGWPKSLSENENDSDLSHYYNMKSEITCENGLVYFNNRIIIPKAKRQYILDLLHETHTNFNKSKIIVQNFFYWPGILSDVRNLIMSCNICQTVQRSKIKEPLKSHDIPEIPFHKVGVDIAEYKQIPYLVLIDYYSRWIEVVKLANKSCSSVISVLKSIFSRFGIPKTVISDNVPFNSNEFSNFCKEWNFDLETISPHHSCSNGLAEKAVGIVKKMFQKAELDRQDINLYLLNYRNSPVANLEYSPAQLLFSRNLRSKLPISSHDLKPKIIQDPKICSKVGQTETYNKTSLKQETVFSQKDDVWVQNIKLKIWEPARIVKVLNHRSYLVKMMNTGKLFRRNAHYLRKRANNFECQDFSDHSFNDIDVPVNNDNFPGNNDDYIDDPGNQSVQMSPHCQTSDQISPRRQTSRYVTRSGREIIKPIRYT